MYTITMAPSHTYKNRSCEGVHLERKASILAHSAPDPSSQRAPSPREFLYPEEFRNFVDVSVSGEHLSEEVGEDRRRGRYVAAAVSSLRRRSPF